MQPNATGGAGALCVFSGSSIQAIISSFQAGKFCGLAWKDSLKQAEEEELPLFLSPSFLVQNVQSKFQGRGKKTSGVKQP